MAEGLLRWAVIATLGLWLASAPLAAFGQQSAVIPDEPVCRTCRIELELVATLGDPHDSIGLLLESKLAVDSHGHFLVAPVAPPGRIALYGPDGRFQRTFGRPGCGPGEFGSWVSHLMVGPGDSLHVLEYNRHTVILPDLGGLASARQLPLAPFDISLLGDGRALMAFPLRHSPDSQTLLQVVDLKAGEIVRSFSTAQFSTAPSYRYEQIRVLGNPVADTVWVAQITRYQLERWTAGGERLQVLSRRAEWYQPWRTDRLDPYVDRAYPRITSLFADSVGHLWVNILVPDPSWRPPGARGETRVMERHGEIYDTVLEVLDLSSGRVLARRRFGEPLSRFVHPRGWLYVTRTAAQGEVFIYVYRPFLAKGVGRR